MESDQTHRKTSSFVEFSDIYGHSFNLHIFGKNKYKTLIGSILSCLSLSMIVSASLYFIINLFQKTSLTVIFNEDYNSTPINNLTQIPLMFAFADFAGNLIPTQGIYSLDVKMLNYNKIISPDGTFKISLEILPIEMEKCDIHKHFSYQKDMEEIWKTFDMNYMLCIPPNKYNLTLYGKPRDVVNGWSRLNVYVNKCDPKVEKCMNSTLTDKLFSNFVFLTSYLSNSIDHYNTAHPFSEKIQSSSFRMSSSLIKSYQLSLKQTKYKTDNGFIFEDTETFDFFTSDSVWMDVTMSSIGEITQGQMLGKLVFENSFTISNYHRTYLKAQAVMANIGGIIKSIIIIFEILNRLLTRNMSYVNISNSIFEYILENKNPLIKNPVAAIPHRQRSSAENLQVSRFFLTTLKGKIQERHFDSINIQEISQDPMPGGRKYETKSNLQLSKWELICPMKIFNKNPNLMILDKIKNFISEKISVENIINKNLKLDQLANLALNENQLKEYYCTSKTIFNLEIQRANQKQGDNKIINVNDSSIIPLSYNTISFVNSKNNLL